MSKTFKDLKAEIRAACAEFVTDGSEKPGLELQWGGHFDGKDRVLVGTNWGRSLFSGFRLAVLLKRVKAKLENPKGPNLECTLHDMRGADLLTLIVQDRAD